MNKRRILGIIIAVGGIVMLFASHYIQEQVDMGRGKISTAQKQINQSKSLFSLSPATKQLGQGLSKNAEKKLEKYRKDADYYEHVAGQLEIGGWIAVVAGAVLILLPVHGGKRKK